MLPVNNPPYPLETSLFTELHQSTMLTIIISPNGLNGLKTAFPEKTGKLLLPGSNYVWRTVKHRWTYLV